MAALGHHTPEMVLKLKQPKAGAKHTGAVIYTEKYKCCCFFNFKQRGIRPTHKNTCYKLLVYIFLHGLI